MNLSDRGQRTAHGARSMARLAAVILAAAGIIASMPPAANAAVGPIAHLVSGCGGQLTVHTPSDPSKPATLQSLGLPAGAGTLVAEANARRVTWLPNITCTTAARSHARTSHSASMTASNWSGYVAAPAPPAGANTLYAQAFWTVPQVTLPSGESSAYSSIWPGLGGMSSTNPQLVQAGTEQDVTTSGQQNSFWFEVLPGQSQQVVTNLVPRVGDAVATSVSWSGGQASFVLCDYTQNKCVSASGASPSPDSSAEWIVERTQINGQLPALANFGTVNITNAYYGRTPGGNLAYTAQAAGATSMVMLNGSGARLAVPSALTSTGDGFTGYWYQGR